MKFKCGKTYEAQQKILADWHVIFAWLPHTVVIDGEGNTTCAWLQLIERKCSWYSCAYDLCLAKEYRLIES